MTSTTEISRRFVLSEHSPYAANISSLWQNDPELAAVIDSIDDEAIYPVEPTRDGHLTVALASPAGALVYLHSKYKPVEEARRLIDTIPTKDRSAFFVMGLGLGHHIDALFDRAGEEPVVCVLENDLRLIRTWMAHRDNATRLRKGRVLFFTKADKGELLERLSPHGALIAMGFEGVVHAPSLQIAGDFHQAMQSMMEDFAAYCRTSINTVMVNGRRTIENIARNLKWYVTSPGIDRLKDAYRGKPAVIVSAGPSLRKNKHLVKEASGKAAIIAVQTTLQPMLEMGVEPDFVTSLDWSDISTRFFEKLPANLRTELVAEAKASGKVMGLHTGPVSVIGNDAAEKMLAELKLNKVGLRAGATVAHLSYYLAEHLGCDPIIFIGQDLGFSDGLCYTPGTSYEDVWKPEVGRFCTLAMKQWEQIVRDRAILRRVDDYQGNPTYTEERLYTYLQQFERDFANTDRTVIDATEGGVLKRGSRVMTFRDAIDQYCRDEVAVDLPPRDGGHVHLAAARAAVSKRIEEAELLRDVSEQTLPLLREIAERLDDQPRVNAVISRIDELRRKVEKIGATYAVVTQMSQRSELRRFIADRKITADKTLGGTDRQRAQINRDVENVAAMIESADALAKVLRETLADFDDSSAVEREAA